MNTFPANNIATQPQAVVFEDARCLSPAAIKIDGVPVTRSTIVAVDGLWPTFTAEQSVLYYRTPGGDVVTFAPSPLSSLALDLTTPHEIQGVEGDLQSFVDLIAALGEIGLPITYTEPV